MSVLDEAYRVSWGDLQYMKGNLPEVFLSSLVGPLLYLLAFGFGVGGNMEDPAGYVEYIVPGIIAMTTLSATFTTVSMKMLVQRLFYMSFDELILCPLHISSIIIGKTIQGMVRALISCTILLGVAYLLSPGINLSPWIFVLIIGASFMFSLLGVLAGMFINLIQNLTLFTSIVIVPMTFLCGTLFDTNVLPPVVGYIIYALPLTHVSNIMRGLMLPEYTVGFDSIIMLVLYIAAFYGICYYMVKKN